VVGLGQRLLEGGVQVAGLRTEQGVDPVRVAGQGGTAQAPAQLAQ